MQPNALGAPTGPAATPGSATDIGERCKHDMLPRHCAFCQVPSKETSSLNAHSLTEWLARLAQATGAGRSLLPEVEGWADRLGVVRPTLHVGRCGPCSRPHPLRRRRHSAWPSLPRGGEAPKRRFCLTAVCAVKQPLDCHPLLEP